MLANPEQGVAYRVGVHHGFENHIPGETLAAVRIYVHGTLVLELAGIALVQNDMWHVATIHWSDNPENIAVCAPNLEPEDAITPDYIHPLFNPQP